MSTDKIHKISKTFINHYQTGPIEAIILDDCLLYKIKFPLPGRGQILQVYDVLSDFEIVNFKHQKRQYQDFITVKNKIPESKMQQIEEGKITENQLKKAFIIKYEQTFDYIRNDKDQLVF